MPSAVGVRSCLDRAMIDSVKLSWALVIGAATGIADHYGPVGPGQRRLDGPGFRQSGADHMDKWTPRGKW